MLLHKLRGTQGVPCSYQPQSCVLLAKLSRKLCSSSGVAKRPNFTLARGHHKAYGFATLAKASESLRNLPLRALDVHIIKISKNPDLREIPHDVLKQSLQSQSKQERPNGVTLSDTSDGPQELMPTWPTMNQQFGGHAYAQCAYGNS
jgi:hypothetical protein